MRFIHSNKDNHFFIYFTPTIPHTHITPHSNFRGTSKAGKYGDFVHELDWSVGEILTALDREGLADNTIVIFSSDNGGVTDYRDSKKIEIDGHYVNGPFFGQKTEAYEGGVHVPLIVRWPETVKAGSESDKIVALTDVLATMAEYTGYELEWNTGEDSFSFLHELEGREPVKPVRENVVVDATSGLIGMRKGPWKFITGQGGGGVNWNPDENVRILTHTWNYPVDYDNPPGQLYNLEEDPGETNNLYYENFDKVVELRALLREIKYSGRSR